MNVNNPAVTCCWEHVTTAAEAFTVSSHQPRRRQLCTCRPLFVLFTILYCSSLLKRDPCPLFTLPTHHLPASPFNPTPSQQLPPVSFPFIFHSLPPPSLPLLPSSSPVSTLSLPSSPIPLTCLLPFFVSRLLPPASFSSPFPHFQPLYSCLLSSFIFLSIPPPTCLFLFLVVASLPTSSVPTSSPLCLSGSPSSYLLSLFLVSLPSHLLPLIAYLIFTL